MSNGVYAYRNFIRDSFGYYGNDDNLEEILDKIIYSLEEKIYEEDKRFYIPSSYYGKD